MSHKGNHVLDLFLTRVDLYMSRAVSREGYSLSYYVITTEKKIKIVYFQLENNLQKKIGKIWPENSQSFVVDFRQSKKNQKNYAQGF